jgi:superfamily II DNA/RNA helicase
MESPSFADLGVSEPVVRELLRLGIEDPFPIQSLVVPDGLAGRNVLARSQTGSGKTLAFAITIVERIEPGRGGPSALVLAPTRELAVQILEEIRPLAAIRKLRVAVAYGGAGLKAQADAAKRADVLVATPGRLEDLATRKLVSLDGIRILVLDEADRMLDMGFLPQVEAIVRRIPVQRQTLFLSATLDGQVGGLAGRFAPQSVLHQVESARATVDEADHRFMPVTAEGKVASLARLISAESGPVLVFVRTKRGADRLVQRLRVHGVQAAAMHGDLAQAQRERALARFRSGAVKALVATDVAARGIHVDGIANVVNYDPPEDHTAYVHRVGRTARAGRAGIGTTLVLPEQQADVSRIAAALRLEDEFRQDGMKVAPPRTVFTSKRGRRSLLHGRPGRGR